MTYSTILKTFKDFKWYEHVRKGTNWITAFKSWISELNHCYYWILCWRCSICAESGFTRKYVLSGLELYWVFKRNLPKCVPACSSKRAGTMARKEPLTRSSWSTVCLGFSILVLVCWEHPLDIYGKSVDGLARRSCSMFFSCLGKCLDFFNLLRHICAVLHLCIFMLQSTAFNRDPGSQVLHCCRFNHTDSITSSCLTLKSTCPAFMHSCCLCPCQSRLSLLRI